MYWSRIILTIQKNTEWRSGVWRGLLSQKGQWKEQLQASAVFGRWVWLKNTFCQWSVFIWPLQNSLSHHWNVHQWHDQVCTNFWWWNLWIFYTDRFKKNRQRDGRISILSKCADTTRVENGVMCSMHPSEGFWLFKVLIWLVLLCFLCDRKLTHCT